jgi:CRP/FNR family transcriptional regulator, dissimilatory nitrate respiration regulator
MALEPKTIRELLSSVPLFSGFDAASLDHLLKRSQVMEPAKGKILFMQGEAAGFLYAVLSGWVKLFRETGDGHEAVAGLCTHGDLFGEAVLYQGSHYPFGAQVVEDVVVLRIPAEVIRERIHEDGHFAARLIQAIGQRLTALELQLEHMALMTAPQRVGCYLLKLCHTKKEKQQVRVLLPYDKTLVATFLGVKLETFSRALAQLREIGVSVDGPMIMVADVGKLQEYVCGSCSLEPGSCDSDKT